MYEDLANGDELFPLQSHAFLDVSLSLDVIMERLHNCQIYPIVIFIKFKSLKQIREVKDYKYLTEKMTSKAAKEMYEHSLKIEAECKPLINGEYARTLVRL